ncbi:MAG: hypothetical protein PHQ23_12325 [Candidatus Wallbacteria bacterium]|nr:hypothetical protein [Candidatus Wallbacteria bacterium]
MMCPKCGKDDNCWVIREDRVEHLPCSFSENAETMLDYIRADYSVAQGNG